MESNNPRPLIDVARETIERDKRQIAESDPTYAQGVVDGYEAGVASVHRGALAVANARIAELEAELDRRDTRARAESIRESTSIVSEIDAIRAEHAATVARMAAEMDALAARVEAVRTCPRWRMTEPDGPCPDGPWMRAFDVLTALAGDAGRGEAGQG